MDWLCTAVQGKAYLAFLLIITLVDVHGHWWILIVEIAFGVQLQVKQEQVVWRKTLAPQCSCLMAAVDDDDTMSLLVPLQVKTKVWSVDDWAYFASNIVDLLFQCSVLQLFWFLLGRLLFWCRFYGHELPHTCNDVVAYLWSWYWYKFSLLADVAWDRSWLDADWCLTHARLSQWSCFATRYATGLTIQFDVA